MADGMQIDPDLLEQIGAQLGAQGGEFTAIADEFVATMEGMAEAYGSDETGGLILEIHQEILEAFQGCIQDVGGDIETVANEVAEVGRMTRELDDAIASAFGDLLGEMGR